MDHPQPRLLLRQLLEHLGGVVRRAVVNRDHFKIGVTLGQRCADGFPGVFSSLKQGIRIEISGLPGSVGGGVSSPHGQ